MQYKFEPTIRRVADKQEELKIPLLDFKSIEGISLYLEPYIWGWINYYDKFRITEHNPVFLQLLQKDSVVGTKTV